MDLKEKLRSEIDQCSWSMLEVHHRNGAVFILDSKLELEDVGVALAKDNVTLVKTWMDQSLLTRPDQTMVDDWKKEPEQNVGSFLIIQPYVLLKLSELN